MKPETLLVKQLLQFLRVEYGGFWIKTHGSAYQTSGIPDIIGVVSGRFIAFEVKAPGGKVTRRQALALVRIKSAGGIAHIVTNKKQVAKILDKLLKESQ